MSLKSATINRRCSFLVKEESKLLYKYTIYSVYCGLYMHKKHKMSK